MKLEPEQERYIEIIRKKLPNKINSEFIEKYYGKLAQAKLGMKKLGEIDQDCNPYLVDAEIVEYDRGSAGEYQLVEHIIKLEKKRGLNISLYTVLVGEFLKLPDYMRFLKKKIGV